MPSWQASLSNSKDRLVWSNGSVIQNSDAKSGLRTLGVALMLCVMHDVVDVYGCSCLWMYGVSAWCMDVWCVDLVHGCMVCRPSAWMYDVAHR